MEVAVVWNEVNSINDYQIDLFENLKFLNNHQSNNLNTTSGEQANIENNENLNLVFIKKQSLTIDLLIDNKIDNEQMSSTLDLNLKSLDSLVNFLLLNNKKIVTRER